MERGIRVREGERCSDRDTALFSSDIKGDIFSTKQLIHTCHWKKIQFEISVTNIIQCLKGFVF